MADPADAGLFSFFANAPAGSGLTQPAMEARRRMALQLMANAGKKGYPKNIGEGLTAIGDALGTRATMNELAAQEAAYQKTAAAAAEGAVPGEAKVAPGPASDAGDTTATTVEPTAYAPSDITEPAPAVAAINRSIAPPGVPAAPVDPGASLTPDEQAAGVVSGGYNFMDAQAGGRFKPTPGYLQGAITSREPNPDMQAYFGGLSGVEAPKGAGDISPTGAAGPYQFTKGTGKAYGIPGAARMDPGASTDAVRSLTADNAASFAARFGRPPTFRELAVLHQQGAGGGGDLLAGQSAPAGNLAANNMAGFSPNAAVAKMNRFYGMPDETAPVSSRDAIAAQLAGRTAPGVPPPNPTQAGAISPPTTPSLPEQTPSPTGDQRLAFAGPPQQAPLPQGITKAPQQVAQAAPATPQRMTPQARMPVPQDIPMTEDEKRGYRIRAQGLALGDVGIQKQGEGLIAYGADQRKQQYEANLKDWQDQMAERRQRQSAEEAFARTQGTPQAQAEAQIKAQEADVAKRFGGQVPYQKFTEDMSKSYDATQQLANTLPTFRQAKQALAQSYTGTGAEIKLDANKMLRQLGVPGDYTPAVATEMLQSRMKAIAGGMIKSTVGSQNISDADREFVEKAYSGTIKMEPESIRKLLSIAEDTTIRSINRHNDRLLSVASDPTKDVALRNQYSVPMQYGDDAVSYLKAHPETANLFDAKFGKGHASAVLSGTRYGQ